MKITIALSALVAMAATVVCASPIVSEPSTNSTHSLDKRGCYTMTLTWLRIPNNPDGSISKSTADLHAFSLDVDTNPRYHQYLPYELSQGNPGNKWKGTRKSYDGLWNVVFYNGEFYTLELRLKGKKYKWNKVSYANWDPALRVETAKYYHCIKW